MFAEKNKGKKVFVGLSGGVDSGVSAALLQQQGYDVIGVFIRIAIEGYPCTAGEDKLSAQRVAAHLDIPFIEIDLSEEYKKEVFAESLREFAKGRTPNPDTLCNQKIKFGTFFRYCIEQGADFVATGHYARLQNHQGRTLMTTAIDESKDQSYFLWMVPEEALGKTIFPIGHLQKSVVRQLAEKFGLPNASRKDSQGLCFLGPITISEMLEQELHPQGGAVLNEAAEVIGSHRGSVLYTLGQRHGFEVSAQDTESKPHYVIAKDIKANTITVSLSPFPRNARETRVALSDINWIGEVKSGTYKARYRYHGKLIDAELFLNEGVVTLKEPQYVPLGQSLVLYQGEHCLGGGVIESATLH